MPLIRIDLNEGRSEAELQTIMDTVHTCVLDAFKVPERDRYQIVTEHKPGRMILQKPALALSAATKPCWCSCLPVHDKL